MENINLGNVSWIDVCYEDGEVIFSDTYVGTDIYTGDINRDRKTDFVMSGLFANKISWFEYNQQNTDIEWTEHLIDDDFRDRYLMNIPGGRSLIETYYYISEKIVKDLRKLHIL